MKNATRRVDRAAKRACAALRGFGTKDAPVVLHRGNIDLYITAMAGLVYENPKTAQYRNAQKKKERRT